MCTFITLYIKIKFYYISERHLNSTNWDRCIKLVHKMRICDKCDMLRKHAADSIQRTEKNSICTPLIKYKMR